MNSAIEMPKYQSHKKVWALKISVMEIKENGDVYMSFENKAYAPITISSFRKKLPEDMDYDDTGYLVQYKGGYQSWSPTNAFEEGYTLIE